MIEFLSIALFGACLVIWSIESDRQIQDEYIEELQQRIKKQADHTNFLLDLIDTMTAKQIEQMYREKILQGESKNLGGENVG